MSILSRAVDRLYRIRLPILLALHAGLVVAANQAAFWLRFDGVIPAAQQPYHRSLLPLLIATRLVVFLPLRLHQGVWRYAGIWDLRNIVAGVALSSVAFWLLVHGLLGAGAYPRSVFIIDAVLLLCLMGGVRLARRLSAAVSRRADASRVLIYGAGDAGAAVVREMRNRSTYVPIGLVDDDERKTGTRIHGVKVLGTRVDLAKILASHHPTEVLLAIPSADPRTIRTISRVLERFELPIKLVPSLHDLIDGKVELAAIRSLTVEDLLERAPIGLNRAPIERLIAGRRVMVTGAGGSIGAELCRQISLLRPASLVMLDRYENSLHAVRLELEDLHPVDSIARAVIADVTDQERIDDVFRQYTPEIVFHAAAHKHVPLMEEHPCEAVKNNVRGTRVMVECARRNGATRFVLISTDKAVNPSNVMGASKRLAELLVQAHAESGDTSCSIVRFGNVLGSNGSVVPRFRAQIEKGGPVTVTHPEIRRFFMLIPEAVQLVLHAAAQADSGATYVLEMGEQVKLVDLARNMIRSAGLTPGEEIQIEYTGLRPGEKLYEELVGKTEVSQRSSVEKILRVTSRTAIPPQILVALGEIERAAALNNSTEMLALVRALLPEYRESGAPAQDPSGNEPNAGQDPVPMNEAHARCLRCQSTDTHRSHARNVWERFRRSRRPERIYRCSACGWRGWLLPLEYGVGSELASGMDAPDLTSVDGALAARAVEGAKRPGPESM